MQNETKPERLSETTHNKENCWFDGERYIPYSEMTEIHLKRAKKYAQRLEEYHWYKSTQFGLKVEKLEEEAERRNIQLPEYRSKFHKSDKKFKKHIANMEEGK